MEFFTSMTSSLYSVGTLLIVISIYLFYRSRRGGGGFSLPGFSGKSSSPKGGSFLSDVTARAAEGHIDPVIGRKEEIMRVTQILSRRRKNNVILVGAPGVGKTAIAEGLALRIVHDDVPDILKGKRVEVLNVSEIIGGTKYRGEFEQRIKKMLQELRAQNRKVILFIDEIHTIMQTKGAEGSVNLADILKPALARGELQLIGATTLKEYEEYIAPDDSWERRFQPVMVDEPSVAESVAILKGIRKSYETYHRVRFTDKALSLAVRLSKEYVKERNLPDKAIDVMDEAGAMVHVHSDVPEHASGVLYEAAHKATGGNDKKTKKLKSDIAKEKRKLAKQKDPKKAKKAKKALQSMVATMQQDATPSDDWPEVTEKHIKQVVAAWSGTKIKDIH